MRILHLGQRVGVRGGAHAGLVGKQAALGALADGGDDAEGGAAHGGVGVEGALEDEGEGGRDVGRVHDKDHERAQHVKDGHDGHDLLGDGGQTRHAADEHDAGQDDHDEAHDPGGDTEGGVHGLGDGVRLHHAAHEAEGQNDGHGEEPGEELAPVALESRGDVVHRAAVDGAVLVDHAGFLGHDGLGVVGGHAEQGDDPHPEDGARAAHDDGAASAHDVAGTHLGRDGGGERLERRHAAALVAAAQGEVAEHAAPAFAEAAELDRLGAHGEPDAHAEQQDDQDVVGQVVVDGGNDTK